MHNTYVKNCLQTTIKYLLNHSLQNNTVPVFLKNKKIAQQKFYYSVYAHNNEIITHNKYVYETPREIDHLFRQLVRWYPCVVIDRATKIDYDSGKKPWNI